MATKTKPRIGGVCIDCEFIRHEITEDEISHFCEWVQEGELSHYCDLQDVYKQLDGYCDFFEPKT